jgi:hypothetical protein
MARTTTEELAHRAGDGIEVSLLWSRVDDRLSVLVEDTKADSAFCVPAPRERALDVFYHPFAYAAAA